MSRYYKLSTLDGTISDALVDPVYVTWNDKMEAAEVCESEAICVMGVMSSDATTIWQLNGKELFPTYLDLVTVVCEEIDKSEYDVLIETLRPDDTVPDQPVQLNIQQLKNAVISEMSRWCSEIIINGIDVLLSDGNIYHFSLTIEDQLNLITISSMIAEGQTVVPYHADGEPCVFFSAEDMLKVIETATEFKTLHTTYFNSLKTYINALETVEEIKSVYYGAEIPEEYQSPVWKEIGTNEDT